MKTTMLFTAILLLSLNHGFPQAGKTSGIPLIGATAPSFTAQSTNGTINFPSDFGANWKILFSHPKDFTPVCSSELLELAYEQESFNKLGAKLIVVSTDVISQHHTWKTALEDIRYKEREKVKINFPLVEDNSYRISNLYGMIHPEVSLGENIRGVFFIDPKNKVRAVFYYPNEVGRNIDELKRTLIALKATDNDKNIVAGANWNPGDDFLIPVVTMEDRNNVGKPESDLYQYSWFMIFRKSSGLATASPGQE
jgi:peroxiredoxin 2/4